MIENPLICLPRLGHRPSVTEADRREIPGVGSGPDAAPATVLPPENRRNKIAPFGQLVAVGDQPQPSRGIGDISDAWPEVQVLPAHMGDIVDA